MHITGSSFEFLETLLTDDRVKQSLNDDIVVCYFVVLVIVCNVNLILFHVETHIKTNCFWIYRI